MAAPRFSGKILAAVLKDALRVCNQEKRGQPSKVCAEVQIISVPGVGEEPSLSSEVFPSDV